MDYLFTFLISMTPIGELRAAIPLGIETYGLDWYWVLPLAVAGNLIPALIWLVALPRIGSYLVSFPNPVGRLISWRGERLRRLQGDRFSRHRNIALVLLVAVPLPFTGVWTGSLAAWVFEIPFRPALLCIALGAMIAGGVVTVLTELGLHLIG